MRSLSLVAVLIAYACAETIVIAVGGNTTQNPGGVFTPDNVIAQVNDIVLFNCALESLFY